MPRYAQHLAVTALVLAALGCRKAPPQPEPSPEPPTAPPTEPPMEPASSAPAPSLDEVRVPPGTYTVGCSRDKAGCHGFSSSPERQVVLDTGLWVATTEVTVALYDRVLGEGSASASCGPTCPVDEISLVDAATFANALSRELDLLVCYVIEGDEVTWPEGPACAGYRLPTGDEWEIAARGGRDPLEESPAALNPLTDKTTVGELVERGERHKVDLPAEAWFRENADWSLHPVGQLRPNGFGLFDVLGNACELTWDIDPEPHGGPNDRACRGGSVSSGRGKTDVFTTYPVPPTEREMEVGLRLVRSER